MLKKRPLRSAKTICKNSAMSNGRLSIIQRAALPCAMIVFALQLSLVIVGASLNFALWVGSFAMH
jgi:hypothetical protein